MPEGKAGVGGAESWSEITLVWVEETFDPGDGRKPNRHYPFNDFRDGFVDDDDTEGGGES